MCLISECDIFCRVQPPFHFQEVLYVLFLEPLLGDIYAILDCLRQRRYISQ